MPKIDVDSFEDEWDDRERAQTRRSRRLSVKARERIEELALARVVAVDRGRITVLLDDVVVDAVLAGTMRGTKAVVGDQVRVRPSRDASNPPRIVERVPRATVLIRTGDDAQTDERVIVANATQVVAVIAADHLTAGVRLLDRLMVAASAGGLDVVLCINKADLIGADPARLSQANIDEILAQYQALGVSGCVTSALTGQGVADLQQQLADTWSAFTGHSGVGKSSLFNRLIPEAGHTVGAIGRYGGRHTTGSSRAMPLPDGDGWIVDTPGIRSFGLGVVEPQALAGHFPELADLPCALDDCIHDTEPGCAIEHATINPRRLQSYRRLLAALRYGDVDADAPEADGFADQGDDGNEEHGS